MTQRRVMLFSHDAAGFGHLRRISRIAASLQGACACLVTTGMREAHWLVAPGTEFVKLPSWDSVSGYRAERRKENLWLRMSRADALELRQQLLLSLDRAFKPDALLVDYLPFGLNEELAPLLYGTSARKYLIHRGLVDYSDRDVLCGSTSSRVADAYNRILVTADRRVVDVAAEYGLVPRASEKIQYVGYVTPSSRQTGAEVSASSRPLVVCACGGGFRGEPVFSACIAAARNLPRADFVIVTGAHGRVSRRAMADTPANCSIHGIHPRLDELHAMATVVVVTHGGYNSVIEAATGGARILVYHIQHAEDDERIHMERRLGSFYPIRAVELAEDLPFAIDSELRLATSAARPRLGLHMNGLANIRRVLAADMALATGTVIRSEVTEGQVTA